jgi:hypothetical protein
MLRSICIFTVTLLILNSPADALVRLGRVHNSYPFWRGEVIPYLGYVDFGGTTREMLGLENTSGGVFGVEIGFYVTKYLELGFNIADIPASTVLERSGPYVFYPELESFVGADILLTDFNIHYNLSPPGKDIIPFFQVGVGRETIFYDGTFDKGFTTLNFGAGIRGRLHHRVSLYAAYRQYRTFVMNGDLNQGQARLGFSILF